MTYRAYKLRSAGDLYKNAVNLQRDMHTLNDNSRIYAAQSADESVMVKYQNGARCEKNPFGASRSVEKFEKVSGMRPSSNQAAKPIMTICAKKLHIRPSCGANNGALFSRPISEWQLLKSFEIGVYMRTKQDKQDKHRRFKFL